MSVSNTTRTAAAGVHLVCADLLLQGYGATIAAEGAHYDVIADIGNTLLRIQVKAASREKLRSGRAESLRGYQFITSRNHRPLTLGVKADPKQYSADHADIMACVALDIRAIAYFPIVGEFPHALWLFPAGTPRMMRGGKALRRIVDAYPLSNCLSDLSVGYPALQKFAYIAPPARPRKAVA